MKNETATSIAEKNNEKLETFTAIADSQGKC